MATTFLQAKEIIDAIGVAERFSIIGILLLVCAGLFYLLIRAEKRVAKLESEKQETQTMIAELTQEIRAGTRVQAQAAEIVTVGPEQIDQILHDVAEGLKKQVRRRS